MKRAFVRLFGCVLSAIGLSMSYDSTFTILLGDEAAPGAAWATGSGTGGTGCVYGTGECYPSIPSGFLVEGLAGSCDYRGENVSYFVVLAPWYVGWLNVDYTGAGGVPYANWPIGGFDDSTSVNMNLTFVGSSNTYTMVGNFGASMHGTGGTYSAYGEMEEIPWCNNNSYGVSVGLIYDGTNNASLSSWRNRCVLNTQEAGDSNRTYDTYIWSAVYMATDEQFVNLGCCLYDSAPEDDCKCYYAPATKSYSYNAYGRTGIGVGNAKIPTSTVPFYEPFVFYSYQSCDAGYTPTGTVTGTDANFAIALLTTAAEANLGIGDGSVCPLYASSIHEGGRKWRTEYGTTMYTYNWDNCSECGVYDEIANASSFNPKIMSIGTATAHTSTTNNRCYVGVSGIRNEYGTFKFTDDCYYDQ